MGVGSGLCGLPTFYLLGSSVKIAPHALGPALRGAWPCGRHIVDAVRNQELE
jgi:hypothetical protein